MNRHFITEININEIRHLKDVNILLDKEEPRHLLLTGKNGSGKTSTLQAIKNNLKNMNTMTKLPSLSDISSDTRNIHIEIKMDSKVSETESIDINFNCIGNEIQNLHYKGNYILAYYDSNRNTSVDTPKGVEKIELKNVYSFDDKPSKVFVKYLVDLKTQQSFARNEEEFEVVKNIDNWFLRFENALKTIVDDESIKLKFDYKNYDFKILQENREPYGFNDLSDGYSSVLSIVSDLILRIDKNRASTTSNYAFDTEGIVLIDELETHLHIDLQKKILPFLVEFFPRIQFIVTTHSPFVLNSIENAVIYDLEKNIRMENLSNYSYEGIVEGYFDVDNYSDELKEKITKYRELAFKNDLSEEERALRAEIRIELKNASNDLAKELKMEFDEIEEKRKSLK